MTQQVNSNRNTGVRNLDGNDRRNDRKNAKNSKY